MTLITQILCENVVMKRITKIISYTIISLLKLAHKSVKIAIQRPDFKFLEMVRHDTFERRS